MARDRGRVSMRRPVVAVRTPTVKASRVPDIEATTRKRKRFGENTGVGSGRQFFFVTSRRRIEKTMLGFRENREEFAEWENGEKYVIIER